jgi:hypothetical protein
MSLLRKGVVILFALNVIFVHGMIEHVNMCTKPCLLHNLLKKYYKEVSVCTKLQIIG